jgi:hypothetical protein
MSDLAISVMLGLAQSTATPSTDRRTFFAFHRIFDSYLIIGGNSHEESLCSHGVCSVGRHVDCRDSRDCAAKDRESLPG